MPGTIGAVVGHRAVALRDEVAVEQEQHSRPEPVGSAVVPAGDPPHPERLVVEAQHLVPLRMGEVESGLEHPGDAVHHGPNRSIRQPPPSRE